MELFKEPIGLEFYFVNPTSEMLPVVNSFMKLSGTEDTLTWYLLQSRMYQDNSL